MYRKLNATPIAVPAPFRYEDPAMGAQREKIARLAGEYVTLPLIQHLVSVECAMHELAAHYGETAARERWAVAGLLHDIDWDACEKNGDLHCKDGSRDWLLSAGIERGLVEDAFSHYGAVAGVGFTPGAGLPVDSTLRKALFAVDELCGFIVACALVRPSKSFMDMEASSVMKKLKDKRFAAQVDRALIRTCETTLSTELSKLVELTLAAMKRHGTAIEALR